MRSIRNGVALVTAAIAAAALAGAGSAVPAEKVWICHGTASESNPYVLIHVSMNAVAGHFDGTAPGHGKNNHPDFFAASGSDDCSAGPEGGGGQE